MSEAEKEYNSLLEAGELKKMLPHLKGDWEKDKKTFTRYYEENQKILNDNSLDLDDEDFDDYTTY